MVTRFNSRLDTIKMLIVDRVIQSRNRSLDDDQSAIRNDNQDAIQKIRNILFILYSSLVIVVIFMTIGFIYFYIQIHSTYVPKDTNESINPVISENTQSPDSFECNQSRLTNFDDNVYTYISNE